MNIQQTEQLIGELLAEPLCPLTEEQKELAYAFAQGLFSGRLPGVSVETSLTFGDLQRVHSLSSKQTFYLEYFVDAEEGRKDAQTLGLPADLNGAAAILLNVQAFSTHVSPVFRKEIAERSATWYGDQLEAQLARDSRSDAVFSYATRLTVNYEPDKLLEKAAHIRQFRDFYTHVEREIESEPDALLAKAKRALVDVHVGRLNTMAAVDVYPGLLSFEEQLMKSPPSAQVAAWTVRLGEAAPVVAALHSLEGEDRLRARDVYVRHLDAIRQGAPFELDDVSEVEASLFSAQTLENLLAATEVRLHAAKLSADATKLRFAAQLEREKWDAEQFKQFLETILERWGLLSGYQNEWQDVDDRDGFAPDQKYQVIITPHRKNMTVDSTRRIMNIPADFFRPLAALYPAGALPLAAHELTHVLQSYADYELGQSLPLATVKGRRYRILREAGGVYQEEVLNNEYFGYESRINVHYLKAYQTKVNGGDRLDVARAFYDSYIAGKELTKLELRDARIFAVTRTSRLYRRGGHNSQVLDYVEQSIVCDALLHYLEPEQVDAFLLGSTSFSLEDSALLHRYGLMVFPSSTIRSPAHEVMRVFAQSIVTV